MLNFLKNLFAKREIQQENVGVNELENWFNEKASSALKELNDKINLIKSRIEGEIKKTRENLDILENAELHNPNITMREKQFMEGNREAYIRRAGLLLEKIKLDKDINSLAEFCDNFDNELDSFGKSTVRSYHILKEFFDHEASAIAQNIRILNEQMREAKKAIKEAEIEKTGEIRALISNLKNKISLKHELGKEMENKEKEKEDLIALKNRTEKELAEFKKSNSYSKFKKLEGEKDSIIARIGGHKNSLLHSFSVLERALKKYQKISFQDEKLVQNYLEMPIATLVNDKELRIAEVLAGIEKNILSSSIELKDKKRDKSLAEIKKLDRKFFEDFLKIYDGLKEELAAKEKEIKEEGIEGRHMQSKEKLEDISFKIDKVNSNINNLKAETGKINIEQLKSNLESNIKGMFKIEIKIT